MDKQPLRTGGCVLRDVEHVARQVTGQCAFVITNCIWGRPLNHIVATRKSVSCEPDWCNTIVVNLYLLM